MNRAQEKAFTKKNWKAAAHLSKQIYDCLPDEINALQTMMACWMIEAYLRKRAHANSMALLYFDYARAKMLQICLEKMEQPKDNE